MRRTIIALVGAAGLLAATVGSVAAHDGPTCADFDALGIDVHGQHVVRDYVIGGGLDSWPPSGSVGSVVGGQRGAALPGGPGPGFHFPNGFAPGASFCNDSHSPGLHV